MTTYRELLEAREWCAGRGFESMKRWYDEELAFQARRRALPLGVQAEYDEDPRNS
jgi:hypothetical protein